MFDQHARSLSLDMQFFIILVNLAYYFVYTLKSLLLTRINAPKFSRTVTSYIEVGNTLNVIPDIDCDNERESDIINTEMWLYNSPITTQGGSFLC